MQIWPDRSGGPSCARIVSVAALLLLGVFSSACLSTEPSRKTDEPVRQITVLPDPADIRVGNSLALQATAIGSLGQILSGKAFTWSSSNSAIATVSANGLVTGVATGTVKISASAEGISASANIEILAAAPRNFSIVDAQFTQGVQSLDGTIPMLRDGSAAVVNVMLAASETQTAPSMQIVLRLFDANNRVVRVDTAKTGTQFGTLATTAAPSAQFLLPASAIQPGMRWQVERDPRNLAADTNAADDIYPRTGPATLNVVDVPPLSLRFVPITLAAHGSSVSINASAIPDFTRTLESVMPVAVLSRILAPAFSSQANFGTTPRGGDGPFWTQLLAELDLARVVGGSDRSEYWVGLVIPPAGFNFAIFGGFGYIPANGSSTGAGSRTTVLIGPGWFSAATAGRDGVAHELGHNFGRRHAPCGQAGSPIDATFPDPTGAIGIPGHDVYAWAKGLTASASVIAPTTGDVMGYCTRPWSSPYTYDGALRFRRAGLPAAIKATDERQRVVIVRGTVTNGTSVTLEPTFIANAFPTEPDPIGPFRLEGLDAQGNILFARSFTTAVIDHAPGIGTFTFALPATHIENLLATVRVVVPGTPPVVRQSLTPHSALQTIGNPTASVSRTANGTIRATCNSPYTAGIMVQHDDEELLATNGNGVATFVATRGTSIDIQCSDGVRSVFFSTTAP